MRKKTFLSKIMLLLCALIVGSGSAWGADVTFTSSTETATTPKSGVSLSVTSGSLTSGNYYRIDKGATLTISSTNGNITNVEFTCTTSSYAALASCSPGSTSTSGSTVTWTGDASSVTFTAKTGSNNNNFRFTSVVVTYNDTPAYTITASANDDSMGDVSVSGSTITASPNEGYRVKAGDAGYEVTHGTAEVTNNGNNTFTVSPSTNCTVRINFEETPKYTVTLNDDQTTITQENANESVELPTRPAINGYTFAGWCETNITTETAVVPTILPTDYTPTDNITLYPVYTRDEETVPAKEYTASVTISDYAAAKNWVNGTAYSSITMNDDVKVTCVTGGNNGKYYTSGHEWRHYQTNNGAITIATTKGTLKSTTITFGITNGGTLVHSNSTITSGTSVNISGTSATFTVSNSGDATNGQAKITEIFVTYGTEAVITTYYVSSPTATINLASACTDGTNYYGTYSNTSSWVVPEGMTVSGLTVSDKKVVRDNFAEGDVVPANAGVLVSSTTSGDHTVVLTSAAGTGKAGNLLRGTGTGITAEAMAAATGYKFYRLTVHDGVVGFWWGAADGDAFAVAANKAYLAVPTAQTANTIGFTFGDESTGIDLTPSPSPKGEGSVYNLQGQRVSGNQKGLLIKNGRKFIVK